MSQSASPEFKTEIKELIISTLVLDGMSPADIGDELMLFDPNSGLGVDSVDALELVSAIQKKYGVRIGDQNQSRFVLQSAKAIADFVSAELAKKAEGA